MLLLRSRIILVVIGFCLLSTSPAESQMGELVTEFLRGKADYRVLFVGNSYSISNNLPEMVEKLVEGNSNESAQVRVSAKPGASLGRHIKGNAFKDVSQGNRHGWTHVFFQDQSQIPGFNSSHEQKVESMAAFSKFAELASRQGAEVGLFLTWAYRIKDERNPRIYPNYLVMQEKLLNGYREYRDATSVDAQIVPVGLAFKAVYNERRKVFDSLYSLDNSHPSNKGSYLAALVFATKILNRPLDGDSYVPSGIDEKTATYLRQVAASVVLGGYSL